MAATRGGREGVGVTRAAFMASHYVCFPLTYFSFEI